MLKQTIIAGLALGLLACSTPEETASVTPLPASYGKDDNYLATSAREYMFRGSATAQLPEDYETLEPEQQEEAVQSVVARRTGDITRAAKAHVQEVLRAANEEIGAGSDEDEFVDYFLYVKPSNNGGMASGEMIEGLTVAFDFELEFVGSLDLVQMVIDEGYDDAFEIEVDNLDTQETETIVVTVEASPTTDSFPKYDELFADGVYDIAIHFGGDYNEERYDLETAKWTVQYLLESGWEHETVTTYDELKYDSGPFTMPLYVEGREVEARVYVYHAQMDDDAGAEQSLLRDLVEDSVKNRDIVFYSGHAGSNAGFLLDYHPRYELDDADFDELDMREEYQIYVFDGCNSYRTYVDALLENPARDFDSTTAVTTVNTTPFSAGYEVINRFVHWLTFVGEDGTHFPVSWNTLLQGVNDEFMDVHYGVHGLDNDPKLNPHGGAALMCGSCDSNADCGAGANYCMNYDDGPACAVACTDSSACGDGYDCISVFDDPDLFYVPKQCVRRQLTCG